MPGVTETTINKLLDEVFANPAIGKLYSRKFSEAWNKIKSAPAKHINSKGGFYLIQTAIPHSGVSADFTQSAGGDFPEASESEYLQTKVLAITTRSTVQFDGNVEVQNRADLKQAPAKNFNHVMADINGEQESYGLAKSRQLWQNRSNEIGRVTAIDTTNKIVTCAISSGNLFGTQLIYEKMKVEFRDANGVLRATGSSFVTVRSVNPASTTFVYDGTAPTGVAAGDRIYPKDSYNAGWTGVPSLIGNTGPFQGVTDRATVRQLGGTNIDAVGATLNLALMRKLQSAQVNRRAGEESKGVFYASAQRDAYEATGFAIQMYGQSGDTMKQGYQNLMFDGTPVMHDYFVPRNELYKVDWSQIDKFELRKFEPVNDETGYVHRVPSASGGFTDKKQILLQGFGNLGTENPSAVGGVITNLSVAGLALGNE